MGWSKHGAGVHRVSTAHLQAAYPFVAEGGLGGAGVYIGREVLGGAFCYDPWTLYAQGVLTNPNMLVAGQVGRGKSAFVKTYLYRQQVFGRRSFIIDPKGEYGPLAHAAGTTPVKIGPGLPVRLNPLDPGPAPGPPEEVARRRLSLLTSLAAASLGTAAVAGGADRLRARPDHRREAHGDRLILPHVVDALLRPEAGRGRAGRHRPGRRSPRPAGRSPSSCAGSCRATWPGCSTAPPPTGSTSTRRWSCWTSRRCTGRTRWAC